MSTAGRSSSFTFLLGTGSIAGAALASLAILFGLGSAFSLEDPTLSVPPEYLAAFMIGGSGFGILALFAVLLAITRR